MENNLGNNLENNIINGDKRYCLMGFVLLAEAKWDKAAYLRRLEAEWQVQAKEFTVASDEDNADAKAEELVFELDGLLAAVSLMPAPVPDGEAEANAAGNYLWPEAKEQAAKHQAHLLVVVTGDDARRAGELFVKLGATCCGLPEALGFYVNGTVFEPRAYREFAEVMRDGELPILNLVWFGLYVGEAGVGGCTNGLAAFGKDEIEILPSEADPAELRNFLMDVAYYVLSQDADLQDGDTIGFSEEQKLPIVKSAGYVLPGETLKIPYFAGGEDDVYRG